MLRSMTGFGAATGAAAGLRVRVELRSVNHRHLAVRTKGLGDLAALEAAVEEAIKGRLERGSVQVHLRLEREGAGAAAPLQGELLRHYAKTLGALAGQLGAPAPRLEALLGLPGVLASEDREELADTARGLVLATLGEALDGLVAMREQDGATTAADLGGNVARLRELRGLVERRMPEVVRAHFDATLRRVNELLGGRRPVEDADLARELALLADRLDVSEELVRLAAHLDHFDALVAGAGAVGRKLEFLTQEVLREVNTLGSKCNDAEVAHRVVEMKNLVERLREQVQNVE